MTDRIVKAIDEIRRLTTEDVDINTVGASIVVRPTLLPATVDRVVKEAAVPGRVLEHREDLSNDERTWFDLTRP